MRVLCVIPARIGSTRIPNKPLQIVAGKPLVRWVVERALGFDCVDAVVLATDDGRIADTVRDLPVRAVMTSTAPVCGTERVAEVVRMAEYRSFPFVLNLQGDEPGVPAALVEGVVNRVVTGDAIATAAAPVSAFETTDPNTVKVEIDADGYARVFSRSLASGDGPIYRHVGVYGFRRDALLRWADSARSPDEITESLEQLRPMALGERIGVHVVFEDVPRGIDTLEDIQSFEQVSA
jgi:3-deoxy-manno-octulosonate cytidylyltransferase (CMP-KDO synthetase)